MSETMERVGRDAADDLADLRDKVAGLMREPVGPTLGAVAGQAEAAMREAGEAVRARADAVAGRVQAQPLVAIGVAALAGFVLAKLIRR